MTRIEEELDVEKIYEQHWEEASYAQQQINQCLCGHLAPSSLAGASGGALSTEFLAQTSGT